MRHFLREDAIPLDSMTAPFAVAPLTLSVLVAAPAAVLVAPPGKPLRVPPRPFAAVPGAVDVAVIAALAENDLPVAGGAVEEAGRVLHRDR